MNELREALRRAGPPEPDLPPAVGTFLRGLSIGALVGAAIAGSVLIQRRRHHPDDESADGTVDEPSTRESGETG
jgi:hypothetical protein